MQRFLFLFVLLSSVLVASPSIVSLSPVSTEIIFAIHPTANVVGVSGLCDFPKSVKKLPQVGDARPNLEAVLMLMPDVVIGVGNPVDVKTKLETLRFENVVLDSPASINEIFLAIKEIGYAIERPAQAKRLITDLKQQLSQLPTLKKEPSVLFVLWHPPLLSVGKTSYISEMISLAGARNISTASIPYPELSLEFILAQNPDLIVLANPDLEEDLLKHPLLQSLPAIKNNRIITSIDPDLMLRAGPRFVDGVLSLHKAFKNVSY